MLQHGTGLVMCRIVVSKAQRVSWECESTNIKAHIRKAHDEITAVSGWSTFSKVRELYHRTEQICNSLCKLWLIESLIVFRHLYKCINLKNEVALILLKSSSLFDVPIHNWHRAQCPPTGAFLCTFAYVPWGDVSNSRDWLNGLLNSSTIIHQNGILPIYVYRSILNTDK